MSPAHPPKGSMPRADPGAVERFHRLLPVDPRVSTRRMFGNLAAFANDVMFAGVFGEDLFVRLDEGDRTALLAIDGTASFDPMLGRPTREYVVLPRDWDEAPDRARPWFERALEYASSLPPRPAKNRKRK